MIDKPETVWRERLQDGDRWDELTQGKRYYVPMTVTEVEQRWAESAKVLVAKQAKWIEPMVAKLAKALERDKP